MDSSHEAERGDIVKSAEAYFDVHHQPKPFVAGETYIPVSGKVLDSSDCAQLIHASLDMWLTAGRFMDKFEKKLPKMARARLSYEICKKILA